MFVALVGASSLFSLFTRPSFALTVFRLTPPTKEGEILRSGDELNALNRLFFEHISARDDILLTQTDLNGVVCIRFAIGGVRTQECHIRRAFEMLCEEAHVVLGQGVDSGITRGI